MRMQSADTSPEVERVLIELIRKAPIPKRFELANSLTAFAIKLNKQNIREQCPNATTEQVMEQFVLDHYNSGLANRLHSVLQEKSVCLSDTPHILDAIMPIATVFEQMKIFYCLAGTIANSIYGMQKAAFDIDFIANIHPEAVSLLLESLSPAYCFDATTVKEAVMHKTSFEGLHIESALRIRVYLFQTNTFTGEIYQRVQTHALVKDGNVFPVLSPEDAVLTQLVAYKVGVDCWDELLGVLKVQKESIDLSYLEESAVTFGIDNLLRRAFEDAGMS